ncbi:glycosyltransferase 87 family protein [Streptomyces sp. URMC 123]|uniref:glycosyltransferase 87 family protein n=1 Tax=Streptomyces sp. URMC 123 TaxID=3423403 RepID=UPI003F1B5724
MLALSLAAFAALCAARPTPMADLLVYRAEGAAVLGGTDLYGFSVTEWRLPATYPPFAALLFVPLAAVPLDLLKAVFMAGNAALLALLIRLSLRLARQDAAAAARPAALPRGHTYAVVMAGTALALWLEPVFQTLLFGQINLALACLVLWDLTRPDGARGKGLAIGIAAGVKLTPAVFAVHLLLTGRVRAGATALAGFAGTAVLGALVLPGASADFWSRRLFETTRVGKAWIVDNQSLQGLVARLLHDAEPGLPWLGVAVPAGAAGLWLARSAARRGRPGPAVLCTAAVALLVSPISWSHHWVWCVPLLVLLAVRGHRWPALLVALVFTARTLWLVPHEGPRDLALPWWQQPLAAPYPLLALALLALVAAGRRTVASAGDADELGHAGGAAGAPPHPRRPGDYTSSPASSSSASTIR